MQKHGKTFQEAQEAQEAQVSQESQRGKDEALGKGAGPSGRKHWTCCFGEPVFRAAPPPYHHPSFLSLPPEITTRISAHLLKKKLTKNQCVTSITSCGKGLISAHISTHLSERGRYGGIKIKTVLPYDRAFRQTCRKCIFFTGGVKSLFCAAVGRNPDNGIFSVCTCVKVTLV